MSSQRIAIAGCGLTGAYLFRLLKNEGIDCDVYDVRHHTRCSLSPCAWETTPDFRELVSATGLDPDNYVLERSDYVLMDGVRVPADVMTFDKPKLDRDLLRGATVAHSPLDPGKYDRIIDATGVTRAFLPPVEDDVVFHCVQQRIKTDESLENQVRLIRLGYSWCFPLGDGEYHVGWGSLSTEPQGWLKELGWLQEPGGGNCRQRVCGCTGGVRLTGPGDSQPFVVRGEGPDVWGVGESIGCVAPLVGEGVVTGMKSVQILLTCREDPDAYTRAILEEFEWMAKERGIIDKLRNAHNLNMKDARVLRENSKRMGMRFGIRQAFQMIKGAR